MTEDLFFWNVEMGRKCAFTLVLLAIFVIVSSKAIDVVKRSSKYDIGNEIDWNSLADMWRDYYSRSESPRVGNIETKLSSALLKLANQIQDADSYVQLYEDSERLAKEALAFDPKNVEAQANLQDAKRSFQERSTLVRSTQAHELEGAQTKASSSSSRSSGEEPFETVSYLDAVRLAADGVVNQAVLTSMRRENAATEKAGLYGIESHRVNVKLNLGAALLNAGNAASEPNEYIPFYKEAEDVSKSAIKLDPSNTAALENLASVRTNMEFRKQKGRGPAAHTSEPEDNLKASDNLNADKFEQAKSRKEPIASAARPQSQAQQTPLTPLSYDKALRLALAGKVDPSVIAAMRRQHSAVTASDNISPMVVANVKLDLGSALLNYANTVGSPAEYTALYRESEAVFVSALGLDPDGPEGQMETALRDNLMAVRGNLRKRPPPTAPAASANAARDSPAEQPPSSSTHGCGSEGSDVGRYAASIEPAQAKERGDGADSSSEFENLDDEDSDEDLDSIEVVENRQGQRTRGTVRDESHDSSAAAAGAPRLTYFQALDSAKAGVITPDVVAAFKREHALAMAASSNGGSRPKGKAGSSYLPEDIVHVKLNLGAALLDLANQAQDPVEYLALYRESEGMLLSALDIDPGNAAIEENLVTLRDNRRIRQSEQPRPVSGSQTATWKESGTQEDGALSYEEALSLAQRGMIDERVVDAIRREHAAAAQGLGKYAFFKARVAVKVNLGAALVDLANQHLEPSDFMALYQESEEVLLSALGLDPGNRDVVDNLATVRRNRATQRDNLNSATGTR